MTFSFVVPGKPVSWKRNDVTVGWMRGRLPRGTPPGVVAALSATGWAPYAKTYRSRESDASVRVIAQFARVAMGKPWRTAGRVAVSIVAVYARPKTRPKGATAEEWATGERVLRGTGNGDDIDRVTNNVLDALGMAGVYDDDGRVARTFVEKVWAASGEGPRVEVEVRRVGG